MTTVQIVAIAVAAAIFVILIVALLVTRSGRANREKADRAGGSFLDDAPQDTLSSLGKAERPVEDVTIDPAVERQDEPARERAAPAPPDDESTGELLGAPKAQLAAATPGPLTESGDSADEPESARPAEGRSAVSNETVPGSGAGARRVPLSDIIVTTSSKMVDLDDPEVRHMLADLVKYEIDQATSYREQGQNIDAVLQLTEAEKVSRALGMTDSAAAIHTMIEDLQGQA